MTHVNVDYEIKSNNVFVFLNRHGFFVPEKISKLVGYWDMLKVIMTERRNRFKKKVFRRKERLVLFWC